MGTCSSSSTYYAVWEKQGFIKTTEGNVVHYGFIETFIEELHTKYNIKEIAFDRWGAVGEQYRWYGILKEWDLQ